MQNIYTNMQKNAKKMQKIGTNVLKICIKYEQMICTKYAIT